MLADGRGQLAKPEFADGGAESVLPIDIENRAGGPGLFGFGINLQQSLLNAGDHDGQPLHAVGVNPPEIRFRPDIGLNEGFFLIRAQSAKDRDDEVHLLFVSNCDRHGVVSSLEIVKGREGDVGGEIGVRLSRTPNSTSIRVAVLNDFRSPSLSKLEQRCRTARPAEFALFLRNLLHVVYMGSGLRQDVMEIVSDADERETLLEEFTNAAGAEQEQTAE